METYWLSRVPDLDDFGNPIHSDFVDGATKYGPWAIMAHTAVHGVISSFQVHGRELGLGLGQHYRKQADGRWLRVEG